MRPACITQFINYSEKPRTRPARQKAQSNGLRGMARQAGCRNTVLLFLGVTGKVWFPLHAWLHRAAGVTAGKYQGGKKKEKKMKMKEAG